MLKKIPVILFVSVMLIFTAVHAFAYEVDYRMYGEAVKSLHIPIPSIMYHKITDNPAEVTDYVVTKKTLEDDFAEIKSRGYTPITIEKFYELKKMAKSMFIDDNYKKLASFFKENPKPIIITVDDGYKGIYTYMLPVMKEYGYKASFYICGELIDRQNPEYCSWEDIRLLNESGLAEIGNHTYSLHSKSKEELEKFYETSFDSAIADMKENDRVIEFNTGVKTVSVSYPYGQYDDLVGGKMRVAGYEKTVSTDYRVNKISDKNIPVGRFNRPASFTTEEFFDMVDEKCGR